MKYLLVLLVVAVAIGIWRTRQRKSVPAERKARGPRLTAPEHMVECAHCGLHLPRADAVLYRDHAFCSAEHQQLYLSSGRPS